MAAKIDPIAGAEINPVLLNPRSDAFGIGKVSLFHSNQGRSHLGCRTGIQSIKLFGIGAATLGIDVLPDFDH